MEARTLIAFYRADYSEPEMWGFLQRYYGSKTVSADWIQGGEHRLDECAACSLVFQRFVPDAEFLNVLYDDWLNSGYRPETDPNDVLSVVQPFQSRDGHEILTVAATLGKHVSDLRVLDYGMGWGLWARVARAMGVGEVFGFDLSPARNAYARARGIRTVTQSGLQGLSLDFINTEQVFEHLDRPDIEAATLAAALRPGGILKISVPRAIGLRRRLRVMNWDTPPNAWNSLKAVHPLEHLNCWTPKALNVLARNVGLQPRPPSLSASLAFIRRSAAIPWSSPKRLAKSLLRFGYNRLRPSGLYRWFQRSDV